MFYQSTRDNKIKIKSADAIAQGLSRDGGLFVPETIPLLPENAIDQLIDMTYQQRSVYIMNLFMDDFERSELNDFATKAYSSSSFDDADIAPVKGLDETTYFLELWHGPTCAFKDMALQILPHFLTSSLEKTGEKREVCVLVATSGDTGKAALEGFRDVPRTKIMVFYPKDGVSAIQEKQMTTQSGANVGVCSVSGNFDDAQTGVKAIFSDEDLREQLSAKGYFLSSANSINWGRLLPQIVYYISAYCDLIKKGKIKNGEPLNFCVPTGNFGDILAGYYAKLLGLPIGKLICASNKNDVLTEFINTGIYDKNRNFYTTLSPSMDILVSSNLERLLFEFSGKDDKLISSYMQSLSNEGKYSVNAEIKSKMDSSFSSGCCSDEETKLMINDTFQKYHYLMDTHTAVAYHVLKKYREDTGDLTPSIVVSTASAFKFSDSVLDALGDESNAKGLDLIDRLSVITGEPAPAPLTSLKYKAERFNETVEKDCLKDVVIKFLS